MAFAEGMPRENDSPTRASCMNWLRNDESPIRRTILLLSFLRREDNAASSSRVLDAPSDGPMAAQEAFSGEATGRPRGMRADGYA